MQLTRVSIPLISWLICFKNPGYPLSIATEYDDTTSIAVRRFGRKKEEIKIDYSYHSQRLYDLIYYFLQDIQSNEAKLLLNSVEWIIFSQRKSICSYLSVDIHLFCVHLPFYIYIFWMDAVIWWTFFADFDECKYPAGTFCHANAICKNTPIDFSYSCTCTDGYQGNGTYCSPEKTNSLGD